MLKNSNMTWLLALIAILAIGGLIALSFKPPPNAPQVQFKQNPNSAAKSQSDGTQQANATQPPSAIQNQNSAADPQRDSDGNTNNRSDEASEFGVFFGRRLKITDFMLVVFTGLLVLVGIGQGIFLYRTDQGTHKAADAAKQAADAAQKSATVATQALTQVQRANMKVVQFYTVAVEDASTGQPRAYAFQMTFINAGPTNAKNARIMTKIEYFPGVIPEDYNFQFPEEYWDRGPVVDAAFGLEIRSEPQVVGMNILRNVEKRIGALLFFGEIRYQDVFEGSDPHVLEFAYTINVVRDFECKTRHRSE